MHGTPPEPRIYEEEWKSCYQRLPLIWAINQKWVAWTSPLLCVGEQQNATKASIVFNSATTQTPTEVSQNGNMDTHRNSPTISAARLSRLGMLCRISRTFLLGLACSVCNSSDYRSADGQPTRGYFQLHISYRTRSKHPRNVTFRPCIFERFILRIPARRSGNIYFRIFKAEIYFILRFLPSQCGLR